MVISKRSQLGLMLWDIEMMREYISDTSRFLQNLKVSVEKLTDSEFDESEEDCLGVQLLNDGDILFNDISKRLGYNKELKGAEFYTVKHPNPYIYLIQPSVNQCAEKIRIKENFSCSIFNKIKDGEHMYLLGSKECYRFVKFNGAIRGSYWNRERHVAFEIGFQLVEDKYYFPKGEKAEFNRIVRLMTFIELGDIEIVVLEKGRNNGKSKKDGKITNTSNNTVYVVDSSWNKIIIRTEGFAVMGHFRLQPCGVGNSDRKLIWIDAFEKHGYTRRPKAEIIK